MTSDPDAWLSDRLTADPILFERLGFSGQDLSDVRTVVAEVLADRSEAGQACRARAVDRAEHLPGLIPHFVHHPGFFGDAAAEAYPGTSVPGRGDGVAALLALVAAVPEIRAYHLQRGIADDISWASLSDLGQQVSVHRETFDEFGLHAHGWLTCAWSGALYWLGRLQFNLEWYQPPELDESSPDRPVADPNPRWVLSTHIPGTGPLDPESVDQSFRRATAFFAEHFPEFRTMEFSCNSWLLDPRMARLHPASNTAQFQHRWRLEGPGKDANGDAWFFLWRRRGEVDPTALPTDSSLRRLVVAEVTAGRDWQLCRGLIDQSDAVSTTGA